MDEGLLNDLLECSVCLERLDTSSRVLPCQHTFCLKCLKVIVESHKELRCPECRVLVEAKVEELPPNVLLMRILEGMRNSTPRKPNAVTQKVLRAGQMLQAQQAAHPSAGDKPLPPHARALYDYRSKEIGDLQFKKGETIFLHKRLDPFWYQGECGGRSGVFPITYVQVVVPLPAAAALCKALYDFRMSAPDEEGCLAFDKGAIITVHRRVDENWAEGRAEERVGIFPIAFVELNQAARLLMNSPTLNRPVPPLPDHLRAGHSDHRHHAQHAHRFQQMSMSTPTTAQQNYQNVATMSQSQPNYAQPVGHKTGPHLHGVITSVPRTIMEPQTKHSELIHFTNFHKTGHQTVGLQSVSRINDNFERLRSAKYEYNTTPIHRDATYQNVRAHEHFPVAVASFNANCTDSSSSNTPSVGVSSTTTPNTSDTSTCESAEPSLPSSPDNGERAPAAPAARLDASMAVLSLNESSTATNTSLNVSLPPNESPLPSSEQEPKPEAPSSSATEPLLPLALGLQAALAPPLDARRDKRHSLGAHKGHSATVNRHSAEILATSLLDCGERTERSERSERSDVRSGRRRRRSRSSERPLPAPYVALYAYRPQKPDELELKKGCVYIVTERCRDGWYKGRSERSGRGGVFPGNYVCAGARSDADKSTPQPQQAKPSPPASLSPAPLAAPPATSLAALTAPLAAPLAAPPNAPPRAPDAPAQPLSYPWGGIQQTTPKSDKSRDKSKPSSSNAGASLMKRLAAMKRCRSPPAARPPLSLDNPVFEDATAPRAAATAQPPAHVRSEGPWQSQHRKSQSLDVTAARRDRHHAPPVKERFRCIVPYPPNSEYELELKVDDIVLVHRKRGDGWYKGTLQRTGRTGLFPASFVQPCPTPDA